MNTFLLISFFFFLSNTITAQDTIRKYYDNSTHINDTGKLNVGGDYAPNSTILKAETLLISANTKSSLQDAESNKIMLDKLKKDFETYSDSTFKVVILPFYQKGTGNNCSEDFGKDIYQMMMSISEEENLRLEIRYLYNYTINSDFDIKNANHIKHYTGSNLIVYGNYSFFCSNDVASMCLNWISDTITISTLDTISTKAVTNISNSKFNPIKINIQDITHGEINSNLRFMCHYLAGMSSTDCIKSTFHYSQALKYATSQKDTLSCLSARIVTCYNAFDSTTINDLNYLIGLNNSDKGYYLFLRAGYFLSWSNIKSSEEDYNSCVNYPIDTSVVSRRALSDFKLALDIANDNIVTTKNAHLQNPTDLNYIDNIIYYYANKQMYDSAITYCSKVINAVLIDTSNGIFFIKLIKGNSLSCKVKCKITDTVIWHIDTVECLKEDSSIYPAGYQIHIYNLIYNYESEMDSFYCRDTFLHDVDFSSYMILRARFLLLKKDTALALNDYNYIFCNRPYYIDFSYRNYLNDALFDRSVVWYNMGYCYDAINDIMLSIKHFKRTVLIENEYASESLALRFWWLSKFCTKIDSFNKAQQYLDSAINIFPTDFAYRDKAQIYIKHLQYNNAIHCLNKLAYPYGRDYYYKAEYYYKSNDLKNALINIDEAILKLKTTGTKPERKMYRKETDLLRKDIIRTLNRKSNDL